MGFMAILSVSYSSRVKWAVNLLGCIGTCLEPFFGASTICSLTIDTLGQTKQCRPSQWFCGLIITLQLLEIGILVMFEEKACCEFIVV